MVSSTSRITAETGVGALENHFIDVLREEYSVRLQVPTAEPVLDYVGSLGDEALTKEQEAMARELTDAEIGASESFRVTRHVELLMATRG